MASLLGDDHIVVKKVISYWKSRLDDEHPFDDLCCTDCVTFLD